MRSVEKYDMAISIFIYLFTYLFIFIHIYVKFTYLFSQNLKICSSSFITQIQAGSFHLDK